MPFEMVSGPPRAYVPDLRLKIGFAAMGNTAVEGWYAQRSLVDSTESDRWVT